MKKLGAWLAACVLLLSMALPALASDTSTSALKKSDEEETVIRYCEQEDCDGILVHEDPWYSRWYTVDIIVCVHGNPWVTDMYQQRYVFNYDTCDTCHISVVTPSVETRAAHWKK